jgi:DNA-binding NtrC family response regulator
MDLNRSDFAVLVVEDEPLIRMVAADALKQAGVSCFEACDAEEALAQMRKHSEIGVLFTDINMPGDMDGMTLANHVHSSDPEMELIVTSGRRNYSDNELPDSGTFLPKPYSVSCLLEIVRRKIAARARGKPD